MRRRREGRGGRGRGGGDSIGTERRWVFGLFLLGVIGGDAKVYCCVLGSESLLTLNVMLAGC